MQIKENLNSNNSLKCPHQLDRIYPLLFYGLHVCYTGVILKISLYCSNGKYQEKWKYTYMFTKEVSVFQKCPGRKVRFLCNVCIPTSFSSTLNTKYLELRNFSSKWIQLSTCQLSPINRESSDFQTTFWPSNRISKISHLSCFLDHLPILFSSLN